MKEGPQSPRRICQAGDAEYFNMFVYLPSSLYRKYCQAGRESNARKPSFIRQWGYIRIEGAVGVGSSASFFVPSFSTVRVRLCTANGTLNVPTPRGIAFVNEAKLLSRASAICLRREED